MRRHRGVGQELGGPPTRVMRREVGGPDVAWVGALFLLVGVAAATVAHGVGPWVSASRDAGALLTPAVAVVVALAATAAGCVLLVDSAPAPSRHVFCFAALRRLAAVLTLVGLGNVVLLFCSDFFWRVWTYGRIGTCAIACIGSIGTAATALVSAAIATRLAWRAYLEEYWQ